MKIIVTINNIAGVVHAGASVESKSGIIEIDNDKLPDIVKNYLTSRDYKYLTFSLLEE